MKGPHSHQFQGDHLEGFLNKRQIELRNGKILKFSGTTEAKNSIQYYRYHGFRGFLRFCFDAVIYWENVILLPYIAINMVADSWEGMTKYFSIVILAMNIIVAALVNTMIDYKLRRACMTVNSKEVHKFVIAKKTKQFETRTWASLIPGDIIKIKENEEFPADVLILDVNCLTNDNKCYVRGGFFDDFTHPTLKKSCEGTQNRTPGIKMPATQFVDQISGLVKYEYNYEGFFSGSYKLNNNPAAFTLTNENVAMRGSYLCNTKSAICLVLNVGEQCMGSIFKGFQKRNISQMSRTSLLSNKKNHDYIYNSFRMFQFSMVFIYLVITFITQFQVRFSGNQQHKWLDVIAKNFVNGQSSANATFIKEILGFCSQLFISLPLSYRLIMDILVLSHSNFAEWDYNVAPANLKFNQGIQMKILGTISNIFLSKSALMCHNVQKAKVVQIKKTQYFDNEEADLKNFSQNNGFSDLRFGALRKSVSGVGLSPKQMTNANFRNYQYPVSLPYRRNDDVNTSYVDQPSQLNAQSQQQEQDETIETYDDYLPNSVDFQPSFSNQSLSNDLIYSNQKELIFEFMRSLTLCHQAVRRKEPSPYSKSLYKSINAEEQAQLMMAHSYGFEFLNKTNKTITVSCQGNRERFDVIVSFDFQFHEQHITVIVIKPFQTSSSGSTLIVKGPMGALLEFLVDSPYEMSQYLTDLKKYTQIGIHPIMMARKNLNNEETHDLEARINEAMSLVKDQEDKIESSLQAHLVDLVPLGIFGIQDTFNMRDSLAVQDMLRNGVKVWLLSKEDEISQVMNCNAMKLLSNNSNPIIINGETEKDVEEQIKSTLKSLNETGSQTKEKKFQFNRTQTQINIDDSSRVASQKNGNNKPDKKTLLISGHSLKYIFRDESLLKCFLTLAMFSDFIVGFSITSSQRADLMKYVKQFAHDDTFTMAVIAASEDQNLILEADVSVALNVRFQQSDTLISSDIVMSDIYPLTYLLFKHGTQCHRRMNETTKVFLYRTFFIGIVILYYMCLFAMGASLPFKDMMFLVFIVALSNIQILLYGISYRDRGYDYLYRIFGEYKRNFVISLYSRFDFGYQLFLAILDSILLLLIFWQQDYILTMQNGMPLPNDGFTLYSSIVIQIIFTLQLTNTNETVTNYSILIFLVNIIGFMFIFDDQSLFSISSLVQCASALLYILFVLLTCLIRNYMFRVLRQKLIPSCHSRFEFYRDVEDRLFLEEFEDPNQEFRLEQFEQDFQDIQKQLQQKKVQIVNSNLMKIERSDSMDAIIEKINEQNIGKSNKFQDSTILNWFSLKFNDQNKEIEYIDARTKEDVAKFRKILVITLVFNIIEMIKEIIISSINLIPFYSFYFYLGFLIFCLVLLIATYKYAQHLQIIYGIAMAILGIFYCFCYYYIEMIDFSMFMIILTLTFSLNGGNVRVMIAIALGLYILQINLLNAQYEDLSSKIIDKVENKASLSIPFIAVLWIYFIALWSFYIYWRERDRKLDFWFGIKKMKEFQKMKSILHILMPAFVRERIRQGQRYIADDQGEVSIIFCDIANFDNIVQMFSGRELCEWLDHIYNAFDQLCEQHALQKIETVGKTYMACGGLKQCEKKFDQRLLSKHHAERVTEFAFNMTSFVKNQRLKDGSFLKVKIGIHSGQVICGVVGENKPQFSLVGDTVNKTSRVCGQAQPNRILISRETHRHLESNSNLFYFDQVSAFFKGIGQEDAYYVHKVRGNNALQLRNQRNLMRNRERSTSFKPSTVKLHNLKQSAKTKQSPANRISPMPRRSAIDLNDNNIGNVQDTSRSLIMSDKASDNNDPLELLNQSSDSEHFGEDDSFRDHHNFFNFGELKDDRQIYKSQVENSEYHVVDRPNYLLQFNLSNQNNIELEEEFRLTLYTQNYWRKVLIFISFVVFNKLEIVYFAFQYQYHPWLKIFIIVGCPLLVLVEILIVLRWKYLKRSNVKLLSTMVSLYFVLILVGTTAQCYGTNQDSRLLQIYMLEILITCSVIYFMGTIQLQSAVLVYFAGVTSWIVTVCLVWDMLTTKSFSFLFEFLFYITLHQFKYHGKEMNERKHNNRKKIIDVEIEKTSKLLNNLVPPPVLQGIRNDQKVVDELEDVTLLFTDMVKFTNFSNNVKNPKEVVKLLSDLFTRFDQVCVQNKVYKVHTIGDCYVIMGYTGHIPQNERTAQIKAQEAYRVIQTGFEMINIIHEVRKEHSHNPDLSELNMRIGIHTGKIVAGIIGTKIVRYDIFGADVLIANKMESHGEPGAVVVSEDTKRIILAGDHELYSHLEFKEHKLVDFEAINRQVQAYFVDPSDSPIQSRSSFSSGEYDESESDSENLSLNAEKDLIHKQNDDIMMDPLNLQLDKMQQRLSEIQEEPFEHNQ